MLGIIYIQDISDCPFLDKYIEILEKNNEEYNIIYWNRNCNEEEGIHRSISTVEYRCFQDVSMSKRKKIRGFLEYRLFLTKEIKRYDKLVLLTTLSAFLLFDKLARYKNNYIFDYRDPSFEDNKFFYLLLKYVIQRSYFTCISSINFKNILPKYKYFIAHNFRYIDLSKGKNMNIQFKKKKIGQKLNLVYVGAIREYDHIKKMIELFSNDERFFLYFHGKGTCEEKLNKYVINKNINNVIFSGYYENDKKYDLLIDADIINNHYPATKKYSLCTSNKFYDGLILHKPLLFNNQCGFDGLSINTPLKTQKDKDYLYNSYFEINEELFNKNCNVLLDKVLLDDKLYLDSIYKFITKKEEQQ